MLEITEAPENGHVGIRASSPQKVTGSTGASTSVPAATGDKQEELEAIMQQENNDSCHHKTQWDDWHKRSAATDSYKLFRRDREERRGRMTAT